MSALRHSQSRASVLSTWWGRTAIAIGVIAAIVAIAWLAVPYIVRDQVQTRLSESLRRTTTVGAVDFNPFTLRVALHDVAIAGRDGGKPLLTIGELWANVSAASLWHRAPVLDALRLVNPSVDLSRGTDGRYSIQDLIDDAAGAPDTPMPAFSLNNIEVEGGNVTFEDGVTGRNHRAENVALGVPFLSTLPYETGIRVNPHLSGTFNGSHLALDGVAMPFAEHREAAIDVDIDALPLREYVAYLPAAPRVVLSDGKLTTRLRIAFVEGAANSRALEIRGTASLDDLAVDRRDGSALARAQRIAVDLDRVDVFARDARIAAIAIDALALDVKRAGDGTMELAQPLFDGGSGPRTPPWTVTVAKASIKDGKLALLDGGSGFRSNLVDVAVDASNVSTQAGQKAQVALSFVTDDRIAAFKGEAEVEPLVPAMSGTFELRKFSLGLLFPYYKDVLAVEVLQGSLDLAGRFALEADGNVKVADGTGSIANLALAHAGRKQAFAKFPAISTSGVVVDVDARRVGIGELGSRDASLRIARERDGTIDATRLMKTSRTTGTAHDEATWALVVSKLALERVSLDVEDRVPDPAIKLVLRDFGVTAANVSNARGAKSTLTLRTRVGERGRIAWTGALATNPPAAGGRIEATGVDLVALRPYIESQVNVSLTAGTLAATGTFDVHIPENGASKAAWKGNAIVTDFAALDKPTSSDLLRWKRLVLDGMDVTLDPWRVAVGRIGIEDYYARTIVYPDGTLNLTRLLTPGKPPEPSADAKPQASESPAVREALPVTIGRIELLRGNVNFSDFFVQPNYSANLTDVAGTVSAMSADLAGDIAITARVDSTAPVEVSGHLQPFAMELSLDIAAKARDVDLPPLTPYAVKYAGYGIEKGKLTFDVHYRVENRKLSADNRLVLVQLTFNPQRVDSATATKLPVLLAVALLKDTRGVIDISLPIAGSLDDPEFSVGGLVIRVIVNLITKAVTAPFALLSAAFGRGEELSTIPFPAASAAVDGDGTKRLDTLGKALGDRPGLKLDIGGRADADLDREALRRASLETAMKREKMKSLAAQGQAPISVEAVTIEPTERTRWLTAAYRESTIKDRPRNAIGMLKELPPNEMEALLLADAKVDDDALRALANARAQAVKAGLVSRSVAGERLFITAPRLSNESAKIEGGAARVDLALR